MFKLLATPLVITFVQWQNLILITFKLCVKNYGKNYVKNYNGNWKKKDVGNYTRSNLQEL